MEGMRVEERIAELEAEEEAGETVHGAKAEIADWKDANHAHHEPCSS